MFSNKQPQNLRNEIKTYKHQLREDKGQSFIVSYKNKFERRLNQGESFLWVFTVDQDLIIGSKKNNQHPVVGHGKDVYSAGEGVKPAAATDIFDLEKGIALIEEQIKKMKAHQDEHPEDKRLYKALIEERELRLYESLSELEIKRKKPVDKTAIESDIVAINLRSGHYRPSIDMNRWRVAEFAWSKAGYKVVRKEGSFLPPMEDREELPPMEKPTENPAAIEGLDNLIKDLDNLTEHNEILSVLKNLPLPTMGGQPGMEDLDDLIADLENLIKDLDKRIEDNQAQSRHRIS